MKVKSIMIEFELDDKDEPSHATNVIFAGGMWSANGPMYSRLTPALNEIWKLLKGVMVR